MRIGISRSAGSSLAIAGLILLTMRGELDWLVILFPASLVLGYGMMRLGEDRNPLTRGMKKG
jgi:hypothetical protein